MGEVLVRRYEADDAQACCHVVNSAIVGMDGLNDAARHHIAASNTPQQLGADLSSWVSFVAELEGLGVVGVGALDDREVKRVYIGADAHGHGVGTALLGALEATAAAQGIDAVTLDASPSSVGFYESLGYLVRSNGGFSIGDAEFRFVTMSKTLNSTAMK